MDSVKLIQEVYRSYLKSVGSEEVFANEDYDCYLCPNKIDLENDDLLFMILACMGDINKGMIGICDSCMKKIYKV